MSKKKKKNKEKITYIDDGSTVYDMSGIGGVGKKSSEKRGISRRVNGKTPFQTYRESVKMMFIPMLVTLAGIAIIFLIIYLILTVAEMNL